MRQDVTVHHPGADVVLGDADPPRPPAHGVVRRPRGRVAVQLRRVPPSRGVPGGELLLVLDSVVRPIARAEVEVVRAVGVHRVRVEAARGARVAQPDDVERLAHARRERPGRRVPSSVGDGGVVVGHCALEVC